jgi:hypothetical protein
MSDGRRFTIRRLEPSDDRSGLDSGQVELDRFFHRFAGQNPFRHHLGVTYVAVMDDKTDLVLEEASRGDVQAAPLRIEALRGSQAMSRNSL